MHGSCKFHYASVSKATRGIRYSFFCPVLYNNKVNVPLLVAINSFINFHCHSTTVPSAIIINMVSYRSEFINSDLSVSQLVSVSTNISVST